MKFVSPLQEEILIAQVTPAETFCFEQELEGSMTVLWNTGPDARFILDNKPIEIEKDCISFFTEFHKVRNIEFSQLNIIQFNRAFYCVESQDHETGCRGILFYSPATVPKLIIPEERRKQFYALWDTMLFEMEEQDELKLDMLQNLLKRFLILSLRVYRAQSHDLPADDSSLSIVREFNYLASIHFRQLSQVKDYAEMLNKSPKTLSNIFKKFTDKTPLQIINEFRMREAKHLLRYTDKHIQEISDELNFKDIQAFSNFFKKRENQAPTLYRASLTH